MGPAERVPGKAFMATACDPDSGEIKLYLAQLDGGTFTAVQSANLRAALERREQELATGVRQQ